MAQNAPESKPTDLVAEVNLTRVKELVLKLLKDCAGYDNLEVITAFAYYISKGDEIVNRLNRRLTELMAQGKEPKNVA